MRDERKLRLFLLTPKEIEKLHHDTAYREYSKHDREALGLLANGIYDYLTILETHEMDGQDNTPHLTSFQILRYLIEPIQDFLFNSKNITGYENTTEEANP